jgi:alcohol dehydrogenase, propanol-preferring
MPTCHLVGSKWAFPVREKHHPELLKSGILIGMKACVLESMGGPLVYRDFPDPLPAPGQVLLKVKTCGVCRTDLHILDGELDHPNLPLIPGHEIIGQVEALGPAVVDFKIGDMVGVPWLGSTCGRCRFCASRRENLCDHPGFTGYTLNGGYAEKTVADSRFCFHIPPTYNPIHAAPLMCAGLIGFRSYRMIGEGVHRLGLYGFGAAAHITAQIAVASGQDVFAFTRPGDNESMAFARRLGAVWAGPSDQRPPVPLDAAIIYAPLGKLVPAALKSVDKGGTVVCAGIYMDDIPSFPYADLWEERSIRSVANLTRQDGDAFFDLLGKINVKTEVTPYPLVEANRALDDLRRGNLQGAAVLLID